MKKILSTSILSFCVFAMSYAQVPTQRVCGTIQHHEYLKQTRPNYERDLSEYNQMIEQYLQDKAAGLNVNRTSGTSAIVTIPVVVHVVYNGAAENISDAQAASQVQVLNDDFAKLNSDAGNVTQPAFAAVAAGAQIRFCLAQRDPNGNATTGVVHKSTTAASFGTNDAVKSAASGGDNPWDVTKYVNIWVCDLSGTLLGYGEFPTGTISNTWGLVIDYAYAGSGGSATPPFNLGRTGTHEFGHCFNLLHIWGDDNGACSGSDGCSDTPNQASEHYGSFPVGSTQTDACSGSSPGTMWMNYMDYTDDGSMYMFTQQQVARMEAVVNTAPWNVLQTSTACTPPIARDAGISNIIKPANGISTCNNAVTPQITVINSASVALTSVRIQYKMDATATQTLNWTGSLATGATTVLTLNAYTGLTTGAHTFSVWTSLPNGGTDQNTANDSKSSTFTVTAAPVGSALPFVENFESGVTPPAGWVIQKSNTIDAATSWSVVSNATGLTAGSTKAARMDNYSSNSDITGQIDALRSPALTFTAANTSLSLNFDVSHRIYGAPLIDSLNVYISTDCGGSWTRLYTKGGSQLATAVGSQTTAFTPTANAQWRRETVSLSAYAGSSTAYLKFESRSGYGNYVWLDNINVSYTTAATPPVANFSIAALPRCTGSSVQLTDMSTNTPTTWTWTATSSVGVTFSNANAQNPTVSFANAGTYTIGLSATNASGTGTTTRTLTINATPTVAVSNATVCAGNSTTLTASGATTYSWNTGATTATLSVAPSSLTVYTVTGTTSGCSNTKTVSVTVTANPTVTVNSATICAGKSATLTAAGATTYSWSTTATTASVSVSPTTTTTYTVRGTTSGCTNTKTLSVTVNTVPAVAATSATICSGTSGTLTASGASTYSWNTGATGANLTASPTGNTNYTVTGTSTQGCVKTATASITVKTTPTVAVSSATVCNGNAANLTATGATTYSWNTGATTSSISVTPTTTTNYTVTGTTVGCSNTKTLSVTVNIVPAVAATSATICSGTTGTLTASGASTYSWNTGATGANLTASPTGNTNYTVTGTSAQGCTKTATASISVNATPTVAVNNATICIGNSASLTAATATSYSWNTGATTASISVSPTVTTTYTVRGTTGSCFQIKTATVTVNNLPNVSVASTTICAGSTGTLTASGASIYSWNTGASTASISDNPTINTNYTVTGTSVAGCVKTATANIVVGSAPAITVNSASICTGGTATLTASGVSSYTWNTGSNASSISVNPTSTTIYTVSGNLAGCGSTAVSTATVTFNTNPTVTLGMVPSPLCVNSTTVALSGSPAGGTYSGAGVSGSTFDPSVSGAGTFTINYAYTDANSCSNSANQSVVVSLCTGIEELNASNVLVYPNPAKDAVNVSIDGVSIDNATIELYDAIGKLVTSEKVNTSVTTISVSHLAKGMYTIRIMMNGKQTVRRIIKE